MDNKYLLVISTLNLFFLPIKEVNISYSNSIQNQLNELEGDYFTFLHKDYIKEVTNTTKIEIDLIDKIEEIRLKISGFESSLWNPAAFVYNADWIDIRFMVLDVLFRFP